MSVQLPLGIGLRDSATFSNFYAIDNTLVINTLKALTEPYIYIWGGPGAGKTHLLQAVCHESSQQGLTPAYIPLQEAAALEPSVFEGLEALDVVCLDDIQAIAGQADWERALFNLYNRIRETQCHLIATCQFSPKALNLSLPDLLSRLSWGPVFQLQALDDKAKRKALQLRARARGMVMPDEVVDFLLKRSPRDMNSLFELLDKLDQASLAAQRKLTIPFVREYL